MLTHIKLLWYNQIVVLIRNVQVNMEEYPSLVEGTGLENREVVQTAQGFESLFLRQIYIAGWSSSVARWAHNPKVEGSNPSPATNLVSWCSWLTRLPVTQKIAGSSPVETAIYGFIAQSVEQGTENPCVAGSIPAGATIFVCSRDVFNLQYKLNLGYALVAQLDRVFGYEPKGQGFESLRAHHISGSGSTW